MKLKKMTALLLATIMLLGLLAGCGNNETPAPETNKPSNEPAADADDNTKEPENNDREEVELLWYVAGSGPQADLNSVLDEANAYLLEKLNCTLKIIETDFGNYDQKMQMVISGQEEFDLCYTAHWSNNFYNNVNKNAFLPLDDLLDEYAPDLKALIPVDGWDAAKVKGEIMAVPNYQIWAMTNGLELEMEYVEKYDYDPESFKTLTDLEPLLEAIKADNPDMFPVAASMNGIMDFITFYLGYDELAGRHIPGVILLEDDELTVVNQFELPQVQEFYETMYDWNQKGYIRQDAATLTDLTQEYKSGKHPVDFLGTMKPGNDVVATNTHGGREVKSFAITDSWLTTSGITATMTAVSRTSKNPERAVEFLNLFNTDPYLYNLITMGIEGKHYEKIDDDFIELIDNSGYFPNADWMYGNQFLAYFKEGQSATDWDDTIVMNQNAKPSPALGFAFDSTPVQTEMASVSAVKDEFQLSLDTGSVDPAVALPEFIAKLKEAGSDVIIAEIQSQLDAWKATK